MESSSQSLPSGNLLAGTWKLLSLESRSAAGEISYPFGERPRGLLMYDPLGWMSVVLARGERVVFASGDPGGGTDEEIRTAFEGFSAYYGRYDVDELRGTVTHHVEANSFPNWAGTEQERFFTLAGQQLTLRTPPFLDGGQMVTLTAIWERVG